MNAPATSHDASQYHEEATISTKQWIWPSHSEFGLAGDRSQVIRKIEKKEVGRNPSFVRYRIDTLIPPPPWFGEVAIKLGSIMSLPENWDSYGALMITEESIYSAIQLLLTVTVQKTPMPSIVPTPAGGVQLEWHRYGIDLEVEILASGQYLITFKDDVTGTESFEDEACGRPASEFVDLRYYVEQLTQRAKSTKT